MIKFAAEYVRRDAHEECKHESILMKRLGDGGRAGKLADFVLLNSDPLFMTPKFGPPKVLATYVGGKLAYDGQTYA